MLIKKPADIKSAEITPKELYLNRRQFMTSASAIALSAGVAATGLDWFQLPSDARAGEKLANVKKSPYNTTEKQNSFKDITSYNNFYELGVDKGDPAENAKYLTTRRGPSPSKAKSRSPRLSTSKTIMKLEPARRARLPPALRRSLVDGDPLGGISAERVDQAGRADQ